MPRVRSPLLFLAPLTTLAAPALADAPRQLTDADLVAYAAKPFDKAAMMFRTVPLGQHHGATVVAQFFCGDVCPNYTVRIIHYDTPPGPACARLGGVTLTRDIPQSIAVVEQSFCVPAVLARQR
jgi:hypothetical protein